MTTLTIDTDLWNNPAINGRPDRMGGFLWLLSRAVEGTLTTSYRKLAEALGWTLEAIRQFIVALVNNTLINTATTQGGTLITICNHSVYYGCKTTSNTDATQPATHPVDPPYIVPARADASAPVINPLSLSKEVSKKEESKREGKPSLASDGSSVTLMPVPPDGAEFREFYAAYPLKKDPGRAEKAFRIARRTATHAEIMSGVLAYAQERNGQEPRYTKHPATWLNAKAWLNEPTPAMPIFSGNPYGRPAEPRNGMLAAATAELHRIEAELAATGSFTIEKNFQHPTFFDAATTIDGTFQ